MSEVNNFVEIFNPSESLTLPKSCYNLYSFFKEYITENSLGQLFFQGSVNNYFNCKRKAISSKCSFSLIKILYYIDYCHLCRIVETTNWKSRPQIKRKYHSLSGADQGPGALCALVPSALKRVQLAIKITRDHKSDSLISHFINEKSFPKLH